MNKHEVIGRYLRTITYSPPDVTIIIPNGRFSEI
jgi:hypothetical protein